MRPKKVILCVDRDESDVSVLSYLLTVNGYRVITAASGVLALVAFCENQIDLVLVDYETEGPGTVLALKKIAAWIPMVMLADPEKMDGHIHGADALLNKRTISSLELLERVKLMSARKRGLRRGLRRPPKSVEPQPAPNAATA